MPIIFPTNSFFSSVESLTILSLFVNSGICKVLIPITYCSIDCIDNFLWVFSMILASVKVQPKVTDFMCSTFRDESQVVESGT